MTRCLLTSYCLKNQYKKLAKKYGINTVENINELNIKINGINYQKTRNLTSGSYGVIDLFVDQNNNLVVNKKAIDEKSENI